MIYRKCEITEPYPGEFIWRDLGNYSVHYFADRASPVITGGHGNCNSISECQEEIDEYWENI